MDKLLTANVKSSLDRLAGKGTSGQSTSSALPQATLGLPPPFGPPLFIVSPEGCLDSPQSPIMGFYIVRNIVRGILMGARPLEAGNLLWSRNFLSAAVASYYTSAFHLIPGILALNGRIWFEDPHVQDSARPDRNKKCVIARLTRENAWRLESRPRSHGRRWAELEQLYQEKSSRFDPEFIQLLSRLIDYGPYSFGDDKTVMSDGLKRVAQLRHEALYQGFGFDEFALDLAHDSGAMSPVMDQRAKAFREFCVYLMKMVVDGLFTLAADVPALALSTTRAMLLVSVYTPEFEVTKADGIGDSSLTEKLKVVLSWLTGKQALNPTLNRTETALSHGSSG